MKPTDEDMDDIHHALGRPKKYAAGNETFRNHFVVSDTSECSARFAALGLWDKRGTMNDGRDAVWCVNDKGKAALAAWLKAPVK